MPPLPCETHPAQRPSITLLVEMINRWLQEAARTSIGDCRVLCFIFVIWGLWNSTSIWSKRAFRGTKSHPAKEELGRQSVGQDSAVKERHCRRHHRSRALRIAPVCKGVPVARAQGLRHQSTSRVRPAWIWRSPERKGSPPIPARREQVHHRAGRQRQEKNAGT